MPPGFIRRSIDTLAKMGLVFRSDPPKVVSLHGREWGEEAAGLQLSVAPHAGDWKVLSVVLRNIGAAPKRFVITDWLHFVQVHIDSSTDRLIELTPYGRELLKRDKMKRRFEVPLAPHEPLEFQLPIGLLFDLSAPGTYSVRVSCEVPDHDPQAVLMSNQIAVTHR